MCFSVKRSIITQCSFSLCELWERIAIVRFSTKNRQIKISTARCRTSVLCNVTKRYAPLCLIKSHEKHRRTLLFLSRLSHKRHVRHVFISNQRRWWITSDKHQNKHPHCDRIRVANVLTHLAPKITISTWVKSLLYHTKPQCLILCANNKSKLTRYMFLMATIDDFEGKMSIADVQWERAATRKSSDGSDCICVHRGDNNWLLWFLRWRC